MSIPELIIDILSWLLIVSGGFFTMIGAFGIWRFPDFWSRLHAASISDSAGVILLLAGMCLHAGLTLVTVKLIIIGLFLFITGPTSTHAVANAALMSGLRPTVAKGLKAAEPEPLEKAGDEGLGQGMETFINIALFTMLVVTAIGVVRMRSLFAVAMLSSVFSLLSALLFVALDAVDVAFTEAAVGAGISTVLMLGTMALTSRNVKPTSRSPLLPLLVVGVTGAALIYGTMDMPNFGSHDAPAMLHVAPEYLERSQHEIGVPNVVTAILASYRGYDTLGETAVVFTAGIGVLLLLSGLRRRREDEEDEPDERSDA